ncbi:hypothetical protein BGZ93_001887, partial [Podila epicladia]
CAGTFLDELKANFTRTSGPVCGKTSNNVAVSLTSSVGVALVLIAAAAQFIF